MPGVIAGARAGLDIGMARIGLAYAEPGSRLALPLRTIEVRPDGSELEQIVEALLSRSITVAYVGLPLKLNGREGEAARMARSYARRLARRCLEIQLRLIDERLTSSSAHSRLQAAGVGAREHRQMVDQVAAGVILEQALDMESRRGEIPGEMVIG